MSQVKFPHTVQAANATLYFDGEFLMKGVLKDEVELELSDVIEQRKICTDLTAGKPHVVLAIVGAETTATKESREYAARHPAPGRIAEAIVVKSLAVRLMGNIYINYHKPNIPTRMFNNEVDAVKWLQEMYDSHLHERK